MSEVKVIKIEAFEARDGRVFQSLVAAHEWEEKLESIEESVQSSCFVRDVIDKHELSKTASELTEWIARASGMADPPVASFIISGHYACIAIGDVCVWDTEDTGETHSTADCQDEYQRRIQGLWNIAKER